MSRTDRRGPSRRHRLPALALTLVAGATTIGACGSSSSGSSAPSVSAIVTKLKSDPSADLPSTLKPSQLNCLAGVLRKYVPASQLHKYLSGQAGVNSFSPSNQTAATNALKGCAKA